MHTGSYLFLRGCYEYKFMDCALKIGHHGLRLNKIYTHKERPPKRARRREYLLTRGCPLDR